MKSIVIFSLMVFAATLAQGYRQSSIFAMLQDLPDTPPNSTALENFVRDLDLDRTNIDLRGKGISESCYTVGPYGGGGGVAFVDYVDDCNAIVERISIRSGRLIDSIQVTHRLSNGQVYETPQRGGGGGELAVIHINVDAGERIIAMHGRSGSLIDQLTFTTNHGRIFGPYGGSGGKSFHVNNCDLRGILGRSGSLLDSIGFFCKPVKN